MKYAFVEKNRRQYGVPALCEALQVSRSGYYAAYTEATLGQWPLAFWRQSSPSKNLAQGKLRT